MDRVVVLAAVAAVLGMAACDDDAQTSTASSVEPQGGGGQAGGGTGGGGGAGGAEWDTCSLVTEGNDTSAECATFALDAVRGDPSAGTVNVFVKRIAATAARRGSLWLLIRAPSA